jgi:hypothetical protein
MPARVPYSHGLALAALLIALGVAIFSQSSGPARSVEPEVAPPPVLRPAEVKTWKDAALKVEAARGEAVGRAARVSVPSELMHYAERRRFLAIQVAETQEQDVTLPHDEAALMEQIASGALVRMDVLGEDHILYGVGAHASSEPFAHWDEKGRTRVTLYSDWGEYKDAEQELAAQVDAKEADSAAARAALRKTSAKARTRRRQLANEERAAERAADAIEARRRALETWYDDYDKRRLLVEEYRRVRAFAESFGGRSYDVDDPGQRRLMRARLLGHIRPEAKAFILELAHGYHQRFGRPLPVTSLVRDEAYQRHLGRSNPNATTIDSPPHATGLAFDVHYGHMTAAEQQWLMDELARQEDEGRVEALRENRIHFHVFVFPDGRRPSESLIAESLDEVRPAVRVRTTVSNRRATAAAKMRRAAAPTSSKARVVRKSKSPRRAPARKPPARAARPRPATGPS